MKTRYPRNGRIYHSFRRALIKANQDLLLIGSKMPKYQGDLDEFHYLVMALEDRRFLRHRGIDILSLFREFIKMISFRKHGGASTIDMQMVRTITGYKEITIKRKIYEIILSLIINMKFSKIQIMQCYMENAFFGSHMIGVSNAVRKAYGKVIYELTDYEKASLAAMLLKPRPLKPNEYWSEAIAVRARYAQTMRGRVKDSQ